MLDGERSGKVFMSRGLLVVVECGGGKENSMTKMRSRVTHASIWVLDVDDCLCCKTYNCYGHRGGMLKLGHLHL